MKLSDKNYYADTTYLSNSTIQSYKMCSAKAEALRKGEWKQEGFNINFAIGHAFESMLQGDFDSRYSKTEEAKALLFNKNGSENAKLKAVRDMVAMCSKSKLYKLATTGDYEPIFTGEIHGVLFKCKVDVLNVEKGFFTDIKTTKDLEPSWNKEHRTFMPFYENWNYWRQLAIYQELIFQNTGKKLQPFIAVSSKQKPYYFDVLEVAQYDDGTFQERLEHELDELEHDIELIEGIRSGEIAPVRCNSSNCEFCAETYDVTTPTTMIDYLDV